MLNRPTASAAVRGPTVELDQGDLLRIDGHRAAAPHQELLLAVKAAPIVPTVHPIDVDTLCQFADVLHEEGYPAIELLARPLPQALVLLEEIAKRPQRTKIRWGLGTIRTAAEARQAVAHSPDFLVSPAFSERVTQVAVEHGIPYIPGVHSLQDVQNVFEAFDEHGCKVSILKLCPVLGVTQQYVTMLLGCFPGIVFCPTGEVELENYLHWKKMPGIVAPMGSNFVPRQLLESRDFVAVRSRLRWIRALADLAVSSSAS